MSGQEITIDDLKRVLTEAAGVEDGVEIGSDSLDTEFEELGYDSLALLEVAGRIQREYGVELDDDTATSARTPRSLLSVVNGG